MGLRAYLFLRGRHLINVVNARWRLIVDTNTFAWVAGILPFFMSLMTTYVLSAAVANIVMINFMGAVATN